MGIGFVPSAMRIANDSQIKLDDHRDAIPALNVSDEHSPLRKHAVERQILSFLVFGSLVRSGFLMPQGLNRNRNRSSQFEKCQKTGLNRNRPVFCGLLRLQNRF